MQIGLTVSKYTRKVLVKSWKNPENLGKFHPIFRILLLESQTIGRFDTNPSFIPFPRYPIPFDPRYHSGEPGYQLFSKEGASLGLHRHESFYTVASELGGRYFA